MRHAAEMGYGLGRAYRGRGIATDALRAVAAQAFAALGMHRVFAVPFAGAPASCRVLEGRMRRSGVQDGRVLDLWRYARVDA